jgi:hypothetical protein
VPDHIKYVDGVDCDCKVAKGVVVYRGFLEWRVAVLKSIEKGVKNNLQYG